jgi:hypothetical protein
VAWIPKKKDWLGKKAEVQEKTRRFEKVYTVAQAAAMLGVDKQTIYKYLEFDEESQDSVIPPHAWFRLPRSGYIRIKEWIVLKLMGGDL